LEADDDALDGGDGSAELAPELTPEEAALAALALAALALAALAEEADDSGLLSTLMRGEDAELS